MDISGELEDENLLDRRQEQTLRRRRLGSLEDPGGPRSPRVSCLAAIDCRDRPGRSLSLFTLSINVLFKSPSVSYDSIITQRPVLLLGLD